MLNRIFKASWQSPSVEKRLQAVAEMDSSNAEHQEILFELAGNDDDSSVRFAAIEGLRDESLVSQLLQVNINIWPRIAAHASWTETRRLALELLTEDQQMQVLDETAYTDIRQFIAEKIEDIEALETARRILRGKDKNSERIIKSKIDAYRDYQRQQAENKALVEKLIEEVEYLSGHDWLPDFRARCAVHRQHWDSIDFDVEVADQSRYLAGREKVDALLEHQRLIEESRSSQKQLTHNLQKLFDDIVIRDLSSLKEKQVEIQQELDKADAAWLELSKRVDADEPVNDSYLESSKAIKTSMQLLTQLRECPDELDDQSVQQLEKILKNFNWPSGMHELRVITELKKLTGDFREKQKAAAEEEKQKLVRLQRNINKIIHLSRAGKLPGARQVAKKVEKALGQLEGRELAALQERYNEALKTLEEMGDWKNFATEPKCRELCEAMEKLIDSDSAIEKRYERMQALQKQWKELGYSDVSEQYWARFKEAADRVYQPCAEHFQQRRQIQKANLEKRQQFVDQMRELLETTDWENQPDYKAAQAGFYAISSDFNKVKDVEHKAGQKQWRQYSSLKDQVKAKLDVAYDDNIEIKKRLVLQAQQLAESDAALENQDTLKSLQRRWTEVGITRRKQDQKVWKEFKGYCDTAYDNLKSLRRGVREEYDQQLDAYRKIIRDIQTLTKKATNQADADRQFREMQQDFEQLPALPSQIPQKLVDGIHRDFTKSCTQFNNRQRQVADDQFAQQRDALWQKAYLCRQLEAAAKSSSQINLEKFSEQWQAIALYDPGLCKRIESRRESAGSDLDWTAIGAERRMLCIQLEIAVGADSPPEDRDLRMKYQLQRMNESGLGQQQQPDKKWFEKIEQDWLCMPGTDPDQQQVLDQRFKQVLQNVEK